MALRRIICSKSRLKTWTKNFSRSELSLSVRTYLQCIAQVYQDTTKTYRIKTGDIRTSKQHLKSKTPRIPDMVEKEKKMI